VVGPVVGGNCQADGADDDGVGVGPEGVFWEAVDAADEDDDLFVSKDGFEEDGVAEVERIRRDGPQGGIDGCADTPDGGRESCLLRPGVSRRRSGAIVIEE